MQAIGRQPQRAPDGTSVHDERHRTEQTTLYCLVQRSLLSAARAYSACLTFPHDTDLP